VYHLDDTAGVLITDFIEARPLELYPGGRAALVLAVSVLLRRLHDGPVPPAFVPYIDIVDRLFAHVRRSGLFAAGVLDRHAERLQWLRANYEVFPDGARACHNDSLPSNLLFDGRRLWLIDWESAYPGDPLIDIAIQLDNLASAPELGELLLRSWLGREPDTALRARLAQARALNRLYYAGVLLSAAATQPRLAADSSLTVPAGAALSPHNRGKLYLQGFLTGAQVPPMP